MISTTQETSPTQRYSDIEFHDKNTFRLKAQSYDRPLAAILCEQGINVSFTYVNLLSNYMVRIS